MKNLFLGLALLVSALALGCTKPADKPKEEPMATEMMPKAGEMMPETPMGDAPMGEEKPADMPPADETK